MRHVPHTQNPASRAASAVVTKSVRRRRRRREAHAHLVTETDSLEFVAQNAISMARSNGKRLGTCDKVHPLLNRASLPTARADAYTRGVGETSPEGDGRHAGGRQRSTDLPSEE